jgi:hypothetical protein
MDNEEANFYAIAQSLSNIMFCTAEDILSFVHIGKWIAEIFVPDDAKMYSVHSYSSGMEIFESDKVHIGKIIPLWQIETFEKLIEQGADLKKHELSLLRMVSELGKTDILKYFKAKGLDIHIKNEMPLINASSYGNLEMVQYLIENGANHEANDYNALHWAVIKGHENVVEYLLSIGSKPNGHCRDNALLTGNNNILQRISEYFEE